MKRTILLFAVLCLSVSGAHAIQSITDSCSGTTSCTLSGSHNVGDLVIWWSYRAGSTTAPTAGTGTNVTNGSNSTGASRSWRMTCSVGVSGSMASGTWTNATNMGAVAITGGLPMGASACTTAVGTVGTANNVSSATATYSALTMSGGTQSIGLLVMGSSTSGQTCTPASATNVAGATTGDVSMALANAQGNWSSATCSITSSVTTEIVVEIFGPSGHTCTLNVTKASLAASAGSWTGSGCTPSTYIPGDKDSARLNNSANLTIGSAESWTIGSSPASAGTAALACTSTTGTPALTINGTLIYRGPVNQCDAWTVGAGAHLQHDSSQAGTPSSTHYAWKLLSANAAIPKLTISGSSGSHVTWDTAASSGTMGQFGCDTGSGDCGQADFSYVDVSNCGSSTVDCMYLSVHTAGSIASIQHMVCTSCGRIEYAEVADGTTAKFDNNVVNSVSGSTTGYTTFYLGDGVNLGAMTTGTREILNNYIENGNVELFCSTATGVDPGFTIQGNLFYASGTAQATSSAFDSVNGCTASGTEWQNNIIWSSDTSASGIASVWMGGTTTRTYYLFSSTATCNSSHNYHWISPSLGINTVYDTMIFEADCSDSAGGGKVITIQGGVSTTSWTFEVKNSILLAANSGAATPGAYNLIDDAGGTCTQSGSSWCPTMNIHNNTIYASPVSDVCGLYGRESTGAAGVVAHAHDNLGWLQSAGSGCKTGSSVSIHSGLIVDADYNWWYNITSGRSVSSAYDDGTTADFSSPSPPGTHDTANSNPQFVDSTRNFLNWCKSVDGTLTTWADCVAKFKSQTSGFTPDALITWVRAGFSPTNAATNTASSTGSYVGAVAPTLASNCSLSISMLGVGCQ